MEERTYWGCLSRCVFCRQPWSIGPIAKGPTESLKNSRAFSSTGSRLARRFEYMAHLTLDPALGELFLEHNADPRIFIFILDLIAAILYAFRGPPLFSQAGKFPPAERLEREVPSRLAADVEMLMKPSFRRNEQAPRFPVVAPDVIA